MKLKILIIFLTCISLAHGYHILGLCPFQGRSHYMYCLSYMKALSKAGHEITVVSHAPPPENPPKNYHAIQLNKTIINMDKIDLFALKVQTIVNNLIRWQFGQDICDGSLSEPGVKELMLAKGKFDVVIVEAFFNECFIAFAHVLNIPLIQIVAFAGDTPWITDLVGAPRPASYIPDIFVGSTHPMDFWDRLVNLISLNLNYLGRHYYYLPKLDKLARKHFANPNLPSISELELQTSLLFVNDHESINFAKPGMPNLIKVAGVHVPESKPLPQDLQKILDNAKDGVIFFSLGSNLKSSKMNKNIQQSFVKVFSKLKQKVLWKWEIDEPVEGKPENVILGKWFPQSDLLNHPNLRAFITHGGLMSTLESLDRGVPVIGIPIFGDQSANMQNVERLGFGVTLEYKNITDESLEWAVNEILNPKYYENAKKGSTLYHDRERNPKDSMVWWVEHIIRNKGAKHLRSPGMDLAWYQYYMLDVFAFILFSLWIGFKILKCFTRLIFSKIKGQKKIKKN